MSTSTAPQPPTPADTSSNTLEQPNVSQYHPVAAVMGMSSNPVAYAASNASNVIGSDSNDSGSDSDSLPGVSAPFSAICAMMTPVRDTASPLHVPHLYWCCLTSGKNQEFPVTFNALIDHGSSSVLIRESLANELGLRRRRLRNPFSAELAMENDGQKIEIQFSDYVKLQLHDPSALWSSKTVRAIVALGLCAPMILGLPFLEHNDIVVDASARTAIDKKSAFDLLNPVIPVKPVPKQKLKDFFEDLRAN